MREKPNFDTINTPRPCRKCDGNGEKFSDYAVFLGEGNGFRGGMVACTYCDKRGTFPALDIAAILDGVSTPRGGNGKRRFRRSMTSPLRKDGVLAARVYYVWRMARFHGGADVTMPMMADLVAAGDSFLPELDAIADVVARHVFGTDLAAAHRWGRLLGGVSQDMPGLPATAYEGGPEHDGNDPITVAILAAKL